MKTKNVGLILFIFGIILIIFSFLYRVFLLNGLHFQFIDLLMEISYTLAIIGAIVWFYGIVYDKKK